MNEDAIGAKGEAPYTFEKDGETIRVGEEDARRYRELAGWKELDADGNAVKSKK